jgi:hypothetical protein
MPIDTDVGEICRDETVGVAGGGCECVPAAPQPQFSDASNRTPMQVTIFLIDLLCFATLDTRARPVTWLRIGTGHRLT